MPGFNVWLAFHCMDVPQCIPLPLLGTPGVSCLELYEHTHRVRLCLPFVGNLPSRKGPDRRICIRSAPAGTRLFPQFLDHGEACCERRCTGFCVNTFPHLRGAYPGARLLGRMGHVCLTYKKGVNAIFNLFLPEHSYHS